MVFPHGIHKFVFWLLILVTGMAVSLTLLSAVASAAPQDVVIGLVLDGRGGREIAPIEKLQREFDELMEKEFRVLMPEAKRLDGGWTLSGVREALQKQLADPGVDVVLAGGVIASNEAAKIKDLSKPVIAAFVADAQLQGIPLRDGVSRKKNFVYLSHESASEQAVSSFHELLRFEHLAVLIDALYVDSVPGLKDLRNRREAELGVRISLIPVEGNVEEILAAIPADVDTVALGPAIRLTDDDIATLAANLIERKLPSFATTGVRDVKLGILATDRGREQDVVSHMRRIATNLFRILLGKEPGKLPVQVLSERRLVLNMETARALGFSERWVYMQNADVLERAVWEDEPVLTFSQVLDEAVEANLDLRAAHMDTVIAADDVLRARAELFPQIQLGANVVKIDDDRASPLGNAETTSTVGVSGRQLLYAERPVAAYGISRHLQEASEAEYRGRELDTLETGSLAYLNVQQARSREQIQLANLKVTQANLELARARLQIGLSGRADVLRWESQISGDRTNLLAARADREQAETELNRLLSRDLGVPPRLEDTSVNKILKSIEAGKIEDSMITARGMRALENYFVQRALARTPELQQLDRLIAAREREVTAARRAYFIPDVAFFAQADRQFDRSGEGADRSGTGLDDDEWSVGLEASIPIFSGGSRRADLMKARDELRQLQLEREATAERVGAGVRAALQQAMGSYPAIQLSNEGAEAARGNLELTTDSYREGAVEITVLLDAQRSALAASLEAATTRFAFLADWSRVLRLVDGFAMYRSDEGLREMHRELEEHLQEQGVALKQVSQTIKNKESVR